MKTRLAIIGVGSWGSRIVTTLSRSTSLELIAAVTSKSRQELENMAPFDGAILRDYRELDGLRDRLDGVIVATPPAGRKEIVDFFLGSGVPVFAEKPLTLRFSETARLVEKSRHCGVPLVEDFIHLYSWPYIAIDQRLSEARHIEIESVGGNSGPYRDYSPVFDYGPHDFAMTLQIFRRRPRLASVEVVDRVSATRFSIRAGLDFGSRGRASLWFGNTFPAKQRVFRCRADGHEWEYDDTAADRLTLDGRPYSPDGVYRDYSSLELALECFAGRFQLYSADDNRWLSESVAAITQEIADRV